MDEVRVVVVDDSEDINELLAIMIESRSQGRYKVVGSASDGSRAIEVVRETQPDLVLLDVAMPVMDGLQALPHIRQVAPQARVAMLTGFSRDLVEKAAFDDGALACLEKSNLLDTLLPSLQELMSTPLPRQLRRDQDGTPASQA